MPSVLNTDPIPTVPKCNWCTKRNNCNKHTEISENDQEWSRCARIRLCAFLHGLLKELISPLKFKLARGRHIESCSWLYFFLLRFVWAFVSSTIHLLLLFCPLIACRRGIMFSPCPVVCPVVSGRPCQHRLARRENRAGCRPATAYSHDAREKRVNSRVIMFPSSSII